jgi:hypothetical protein
MYGIILCEGETDAILISYYLHNTLTYNHVKKFPARLPVLTNISKSINWYRGDHDNYIAICPIGGADFMKAVKEVIRYNKAADEDDVFQKLVLVMDNDDESVSDSVREIGKALFCKQELSAGIWASFAYDNDFAQHIGGEIACILQPNDEHGALETFVLQALSHDDEEVGNAVRQVKEFVGGFQSKRYLRHRRDRVKAHLSVSLAVMCPSKTFTTIDEFLKGIEWKDYQLFQEQFKLFENM